MGMIHWGVRWKSDSSFTWSITAATIWIAEDPVPMTPTRLPSSEASVSHRALWKQVPSKSWRPSMSG